MTRLAWRLVRNIAFGLGLAAWGLLCLRLTRRSLHLLQLEAYLSARYVRRWLARPTRISSRPALVSSTVGAGLAGLSVRGSAPLQAAAAVGWALLGAWLARAPRSSSDKKPLVMTARATRLAFGAGGLAGAILGLATVCRQGQAGSPAASLMAALPRWAGLLSLFALLAPILVAAANLLLYPVEEALRRYYLRDAASRLRRLRPVVVAVAGSYGKTSTKEFIAAILAARYEVLKPPGSHNTPMGLARVIREQLRSTHEVFVAELGDWVPGDIALLCRLLRPSVGVITTIGPEHLERFKTIDRVIASKLELLEALPSDGWAIVNQDDEAVGAIAERTPRARVLRYGLSSKGAQVRACEIRTTRSGLEFTVEADGYGRALFRVGVLGRHNVANVLAAVGVGLALGLKLQEMAAAARRIQPVEHRLQPIQGAGSVLVIDDAFNSNPRGAAAALDVLAELEANQRILVTPGMVELADQEFDANRQFARQAARVCDAVIVVGHDRAAPLLAGLRDERYPEERVHVVRNLAEAQGRLSTLVRERDVVLFENDLPDTYADAP